MADPNISTPKKRGNGHVLSLMSSEAEWQLDAKGRIRPNENNFAIAIKNSGIRFRYNEFTGEGFVDGIPDYGPRMADPEYGELYLLIQREHGFKIGREDLRDMVRAQMHRNRFHPVRDYLRKLVWDGVDRLDEWLSTYAGAANTDFTRAAGSITLIAAVRRIRNPGCKFDEMLIVESPEGRDKSSAFAALAGEDHFSDHAPFGVAQREVIENLRGQWIVECADLDTMSRSDVNTMKAFLSRRKDQATLKYERETTTLQRQCIFVGTTNEDAYLLSKTGNRRFWPVKIQKFDIPQLVADRDHLWAEAAYREANGESIRLPEHLWSEARQEQEKREVADEWEGMIAAWLDAEQRQPRMPGDDYRVRIIDVAKGALQVPPEKIEDRVSKRIANCMKRTGWKMTCRSHGNRWWTRQKQE